MQIFMQLALVNMKSPEGELRINGSDLEGAEFEEFNFFDLTVSQQDFDQESISAEDSSLPIIQTGFGSIDDVISEGAASFADKDAVAALKELQATSTQVTIPAENDFNLGTLPKEEPAEARKVSEAFVTAGWPQKQRFGQAENPADNKPSQPAARLIPKVGKGDPKDAVILTNADALSQVERPTGDIPARTIATDKQAQTANDPLIAARPSDLPSKPGSWVSDVLSTQRPAPDDMRLEMRTVAKKPAKALLPEAPPNPELVHLKWKEEVREGGHVFGRQPGRIAQPIARSGVSSPPLGQPDLVEHQTLTPMAEHWQDRRDRKTVETSWGTSTERQGTETKAPEIAISAKQVSVPVVQNVMHAAQKSSFQEVSNQSFDGIPEMAVIGDREVDSPARSTERAQPAPLVKSAISQVVQAVQKTTADGLVEVRLHPEELGRVRLTMLPTEAGVSVQVSAERPETLELFRRNIDVFEAEMNDRGFTNLSFTFDQDEKGAQDKTGSESVDDQGHVQAQKNAVSVEIGQVERSLTDGRIDIRM